MTSEAERWTTGFTRKQMADVLTLLALHASPDNGA
jgi:hypothetical protein